MPDYIYYNRNPKALKIDDCVCRAIGRATNLNYNAVVNLMEMTSNVYHCDKLTKCCYRRLLEDVFQLDCYTCYNGETVKEIAKCFPNSILIIRIEGHVTCSVCGTVEDTWDCTSKQVDCFWIVR